MNLRSQKIWLRQVKREIQGEARKQNGLASSARIYRWILTASRIHVSPLQNYARLGKAQGVK
jgi:hypothetical protein